MSINREVNVRFRASGGSQVNAELDAMTSRITQTGDATRRSSQEMSEWQKVTRAMGTTLRYSFAAGLVFGVQRGISALSDFQVKLGQVAATAADFSGPRGLQGGVDQARAQIGGLGDDLIRMSNNLAQPVGGLADTLQGFFSSFQSTSPEAANKWVETLGRLANVAEVTDMQNLAGGMAAFINQFNQGQPTQQFISRLGDQFSAFIKLSAGIRGDILAQQAGRISSAGSAGGFDIPQTLGTIAAASGGSPALVIRGTTQLMNSLLTPSPEQQKVYGDIGLPTTPTDLTNFQYKGRSGGPAILRRMLDVVRERGGIGNVKQFLGRDETSLGDIQGQGVGATGVTGGGADVAFNLFGRVESFRAFAAIYQRGNKALDDFVKQIRNSTGWLDQQNKLYLEQIPLLRASTSLQNLRLQGMRALGGVINVPAGAVAAGAGFLGNHPTVLKATEDTLIASAILRRLVGPGAIGERLGQTRVGQSGVGRRLGGAFTALRRLGAGGQAVISGALVQEATPAVVGGGGAQFGVMGTRANPIWVIIHPYSEYVGQPGGAGGPLGGGGGGGGGGLPPVIAGGGGAGRLAGLLRGGLIVGGVLTANDIIKSALPEDKASWAPWNRYSGSKGFGNLWHDTLGRVFGGDDKDPTAPARRQANANARARNARGNGDGVVTHKVVVEPSDDAKKIVKVRVADEHVATKQWNAIPPSFRGKPNWAGGS